MIVQISKKKRRRGVTTYTEEIECDWLQPCGEFFQLFLNLAGGSWMKTMVPIKDVLSIH